jgi:diguanylate cyclase (GGDEF)-like protein/putative nucleotidyltransferase with HDIG domain
LSESGGPRAAAGREWLPPAAAAYFLLVAGTTLALSAALLSRIGGDHHEPWWSFAILAGLAAVAQACVVLVNVTNSAYAVSIVFLVAAALVLPPELALLVPLVMFVPDWLRARREWTVQLFNICQSMLLVLVAGWAFRAVHAGLPGDGIRLVSAGALAALLLVLLNHALVDTMIHLARGRSFRELGFLSPAEYLPDLVLAAVGVCVAGLWRYNPALIPFALTPLALVQRSLSVPALEAEARVDPKTGLFNARHFNKVFQDELHRTERHGRPLSLLMIDLDLLREINNKHGHIAGDTVIRGIAEVFRTHLRHYDVPSRFGGEEYSVLLPETSLEQALEIAERIRATVATHRFVVETVAEPIQATVSIGVACFPQDATEQTELVHQADLAVYRAKLQGRNRVVAASAEFELMTTETVVAAPVPSLEEDGEYLAPLSAAPQQQVAVERRRRARPQPLPRLRVQSRRLVALVAAVTAAGVVGGTLAFALGGSDAWIGIAVLAALAGGAQALALELDEGTLSVGVVTVIAAAGLFGARGILPCALAAASVELASRRSALFQCSFDLGTTALGGLAALGVFVVAHETGSHGVPATLVAASAAALCVYLVRSALFVALAVEASRARWREIWRERFAWLLTHHVVYGAFAAAMILGYRAVGVVGLLVFVLPLLLVRQTQAHHVGHTQRTAAQLRDAAQTIREQNVSLELANRLLRERSAATMASLTAMVDSRDSATLGHSRRVQEMALALGRQLGLSEPELDLLGHAALFHDIGKLAVPDAVLLKPERLSEEEWELMRSHVEEGARIIGRLGFLADAVPAIRHHHEHWDGTGYPDRLAGEEIPLGARIIHVSAALESMLTDRRYREAKTLDQALAELHRGVGTQFCPRCVDAAEAVLSGADASEPVEALRRRLSPR